MAKPMKTLELHYPMIQFLIKRCVVLEKRNQLTLRTLLVIKNKHNLLLMTAFVHLSLP